ncbi:EFR1 family ferrodoxin [Caldisalinibacter kiritimatiensis]|uniref:Ferredoxin n=1 Tax=Caldisalinibacter kiritimatiensis TaxID=1304284 RepID=R1CAP6_9FIRM|nr:EFR1 family ferrodoxin [Caldisalinibacter kiritimatiensis]EOC99389.1 Ferredoxin [Caldisalinibacter kiritimatiensis]
MKGAIIYFSGTGNTEYVSKLFKEEFKKQSIEIKLIDVSDVDNFSDKQYDFFVFGAPIHVEVFPEYFINWVKNNIKAGNNRPCIIFSTQASKSAPGPYAFKKDAENIGLKVKIISNIEMPNNYYVVAFKRFSNEDVKRVKLAAKNKVSKIVSEFLKGEEKLNPSSNIRSIVGKISYKGFLLYSKGWAKRNLSVNYDKCIKCGICVKKCPTVNITMDNGKIDFKNNCISCQRCIHSCPANAFMYKDKHFDQYKLS